MAAARECDGDGGFRLARLQRQHLLAVDPQDGGAARKPEAVVPVGRHVELRAPADRRRKSHALRHRTKSAYVNRPAGDRRRHAAGTFCDAYAWDAVDGRDGPLGHVAIAPQ